MNIKKCEVFSSGCLTHFSMEMKQSSKPNLEILGIPIGDSVFCRAVLDRKRTEAGILLKRLDDVGQVDPQVALVLLRLCGGYCKLVHLAPLRSLSLFCSYLIKMFKIVSLLAQVCILPLLRGSRPS